MSWTSPRDWTSGETVTEAHMDTHIKDNLTYLYDEMPKRATLWHQYAIVTAGNALSAAPDTGQYHNIVVHQSGSADADSFTQSFVLAAGTYTMYALGHRTNSSGIIDWDIDGVTVISGQDWYGGLNKNEIKSASVTVTGNGRHVLTGTVNGKNGSSAGYDIKLTKIWFVPASD